MKALRYLLARFDGKNIWKTLGLYALIIFVFLLWGVRGVVTMFFLFLFFFLGWTVHSVVSTVKDWRLAQRLDRVHFSQADYETLRRENKMMLSQLEMMMTANVGRGVQRSYRAASPPPPTATRFRPEDIEEMRLRMEMEEREEMEK